MPAAEVQTQGAEVQGLCLEIAHQSDLYRPLPPRTDAWPHIVVTLANLRAYYRVTVYQSYVLGDLGVGGGSEPPCRFENFDIFCNKVTINQCSQTL